MYCIEILTMNFFYLLSFGFGNFVSILLYAFSKCKEINTKFSFKCIINYNNFILQYFIYNGQKKQMWHLNSGLGLSNNNNFLDFHRFHSLLPIIL